jgi:hypothetical protein
VPISAEAAAKSASAALSKEPNDQHALAFLTTAWRLLGDPRYRRLCDYETMISAHEIETPRGWAHLGDYLDDLASALRELHVYRTHPLGQSLRGGSQTDRSLVVSENPVIQAFFSSVDRPILRHIAGLGAAEDPLRRRIASGYAIAGAWSAQLGPCGFHVNHVHQKGWLSSACHVDLPPAIEEGHAGWLKFGEPGVPTSPALPPERFVKPVRGRLLLFPSYFWHGTVPFGGQTNRLSIAFDLTPS